MHDPRRHTPRPMIISRDVSENADRLVRAVFAQRGVPVKRARRHRQHAQSPARAPRRKPPMQASPSTSPRAASSSRSTSRSRLPVSGLADGTAQRGVGPPDEQQGVSRPHPPVSAHAPRRARPCPSSSRPHPEAAPGLHGDQPDRGARDHRCRARVGRPGAVLAFDERQRAPHEVRQRVAPRAESGMAADLPPVHADDRRHSRGRPRPRRAPRTARSGRAPATPASQEADARTSVVSRLPL